MAIDAPRRKIDPLRVVALCGGRGSLVTKPIHDRDGNWRPGSITVLATTSVENRSHLPGLRFDAPRGPRVAADIWGIAVCAEIGEFSGGQSSFPRGQRLRKGEQKPAPWRTPDCHSDAPCFGAFIVEKQSDYFMDRRREGKKIVHNVSV